MNRIVTAYPGQEIHVVLDNLNIHKPKRDRWLARHPNVHFHFTPSYASWLNQVEIWFSILSGLPSRAPVSPRPSSLGRPSMPSSPPTTRMLDRSTGPNLWSVKSVSYLVSLIYDFRY